MVRKLTRDLADLIKADKEHQKTYGFENKHTLLGYNRAILMIEEHGPELISEALSNEERRILSLVERDEENKWVSVEDRLPEEEWGPQMVKLVYPHYRKAWYAKDWEKWCKSGSRDILKQQPTHYQDLPESPSGASEQSEQPVNEVSLPQNASEAIKEIDSYIQREREYQNGGNFTMFNETFIRDIVKIKKTLEGGE